MHHRERAKSNRLVVLGPSLSMSTSNGLNESRHSCLRGSRSGKRIPISASPTMTRSNGRGVKTRSVSKNREKSGSWTGNGCMMGSSYGECSVIGSEVGKREGPASGSGGSIEAGGGEGEADGVGARTGRFFSRLMGGGGVGDGVGRGKAAGFFVSGTRFDFGGRRTTRMALPQLAEPSGPDGISAADAGAAGSGAGAFRLLVSVTHRVDIRCCHVLFCKYVSIASPLV